MYPGVGRVLDSKPTRDGQVQRTTHSGGAGGAVTLLSFEKGRPRGGVGRAQ